MIDQVVHVPTILTMVIFSLILLAGLVLLIVTLSNRGRSGNASAVTPESVPPTLSENDLRQRRTQILERLAAGQLSKEEAESELSSLGHPARVPPPPPPARQGANNRGCLLTLVIAIGILLLVIGLLFFGMFSMRPPSNRFNEFHPGNHQQIEQWNHMPGQPTEDLS